MEPLVKLLTEEIREGLVERFNRARKARSYASTDVEAGRDYARAYVTFIHYVERAHEAASQSAAGHFPEDPHPGEKQEK